VTRTHARLANDVAWGLWAAIQLECSLTDNVVRKLSGTRDSVVALLALHAREAGLMADASPLKAWSAVATKAALSDNTWLLAYEGSERGWLGRARPAAAHEAFSFLSQSDVRFYDEAPTDEEDENAEDDYTY